MHIHTCAHTHRDTQTHTHTHIQRASGGCIVGELLEVVCKVNAHLVTMFTHTHTQTLSHTHTHTLSLLLSPSHTLSLPLSPPHTHSLSLSVPLFPLLFS